MEKEWLGLAQSRKDNRKHLKGQLQKILITGNMSAGKSTLINALTGKTISKAKNDVCTAKVHYIFNKLSEDGYVGKWDYLLNPAADYRTLMEDNPDNKTNEIYVETYFRTAVPLGDMFCMIDTPGLNSALHTKHRDISRKAIAENDFDRLVCVLNATVSGTDDEQKLIRYLAETVPREKVLFVVNQLDQFEKEEDDIAHCIDGVRQDLFSCGYKDAVLCPVSAYAGLLAKKHLYSEPLTEVEKLKLQAFFLRFKSDYPVMKRYFAFDKEKAKAAPGRKTVSDRYRLLLRYCGIVNLEKGLFG